MAKVISLSNLEAFWQNVKTFYAYVDVILGSKNVANFVALGDGFSSLLSLSQTMKDFLTSTDASETAINKWKEIENFLAGVTDTQTLTGLLAEMRTQITAYDTTPTENSTKAVTSGGVKAALDAKQDSITFATTSEIDGLFTSN